ncbi:MAG: hypothetical protein KKB21_05695, partial [Nanoarchaeota archaeon]|nr:hypothetical protein [Nanoarchaeota archaeon]
KSENIVIKEEGDITVGLNIEITDDLKKEGLAREIVRTINQMRKEQKLTVNDKIIVIYKTENILLNEILTEFSEEIMKNVLADNLVAGDVGEDREIGGVKIKLGFDVSRPRDNVIGPAKLKCHS